ncbi:hypothetical protein F5Y00DRAFT_248311 [Daldinia vernicosa]|uniref:uncharacterized protein n=1 Tax=Daldinia vernicosa TaxID=114800 RepID=UPI0020084B61|nr:uncharacterized protein F5Y00DRAFT_248311 [Daldinia vernicosa]KAI0844568.1 hypothetical protein F5Y00DRAFT_248311 [Daldinia vernicosa]
MSAESPESHILDKDHHHHHHRQHHQPQRLRSRAREPSVSAKKKKKKKLTHATAQSKSENKREVKNGWFAIRDIIDEKFERGKTYYLVDWEGTDETGNPHVPSWEPKQNVTSLAINDWMVRKARSKYTQGKLDVVIGDIEPSMQEFNARESGSVSTSNRHHQGAKKRPLEHSSLYESGLSEEHASKLPKLKLKLTETPSAFPRSAGHDLGHYKELAERQSELDHDNSHNHPSDDTQGDPKPYKSRIVIRLPRDPTFPADQYVRVPPDSQQTDSQQSSQLTDARAALVRETEVESQEQRIVPDSQEIYSALVSDVHSSIPDHLNSFETSPLRERAVVASQQEERLQHPESFGHSTEIPSRQPDRPFVGNQGNVSTSTFLIGTVVGSTAPDNSQSTIGKGNPRFLTQEGLNVDVVPPTSQPTSFASTQPHELAWDEHISTASISQDQNQAPAISNSSQAAQVVLPLSSQQGGLATYSEAAFTVYDDSIVPDTVPDTVRRNAQDKRDPQNSSQALSEVDGNTRNTSFSEDQQPELDIEPSRAELSQTIPEKPADFGADEMRFGPPTFGSEPPAAPTNMDTDQPVRYTARERLRLIREQNFEALNDMFPERKVEMEMEARARAASADVGSSAGPQPDIQEAPIAQAPASRDISPLTPVNLTSQSFLVPPLETAADNTSSDHQLPVPETTQTPVEQEKEAELGLEESGPVEVAVEVGYDAHEEEQPATLDPSALTLSIEHDMDVSPSMPVHDALHTSLQIPDPDEFIIPHEEEETPLGYPRSLLPYVPTGPNEYLVTLPFYNPCRPVYNDVLRDNEELIREYNAAFLVSPHQTPHPTTVSKIDEMFSRLFDICDLPPFIETTTTMTPAELTKHVVNTNAKFAFVAELLVYLAEENSDKKVLILSRPGKVMDFLGNLIETRGYRYIRSGLEIVGPSSAEHSLTVAISSTLDNSSSIPEDIDVVIAYDHTYRPELLPQRVRERSILMVLTNICSIQHLNMRVSENLEPLERKNVLVLALVRAMRYIEDVDDSLIVKFHLAAETFCKYIQDPDDDDFYWEPYEVPEDVFEDLHAASSQSQVSQSVLGPFGTDQLPGSRKRSHEGEDDDISSKRPRVSQPTVVTHVSHISDSLKGLIGDDTVDESPKAMLSVSVGKLEKLSAKVTSLKAKLRESQMREKQFRQLSDRSKKEVDNYASTVRLVQEKYMNSLKDRGTYEDEYYKAKEEALAASASLDSKRRELDDLKEKFAEQEKRLSATHESLLKSANPEVAKMARLEKELEESKIKVQILEKKAALANNELEYAKNAYQDASQRAAELQTENRALEQRVEELHRKADDNMVQINQIYAESESKELLRLLNEQKSIVRDRDLELIRLRDELRMLKENRRGTRQSSVPRSPRLSAFGVNSPRNGGRTTKGSSSSRGTSPAPATGIFEAGGGIGTPVPNSRAFHLRESRF